MKRYFRDYAREGELSYQVAKRFAKESTKEDFAKKIMEIIKDDSTDWETISEIAYLCESVEEGNEMSKAELAKRAEQIKALNKDKDYFSDALDKQIEATYKVVEENTELKDKLNNLSRVAEVRLGNWQKYADAYNETQELLDKQIEATYKVVEKLNKVKELLREFVEWANWQGNSKCPSFKSIQDKAEAFLKE